MINIPQHIRDHIAYDPSSPSGLVWLTKPNKRIVVGSLCGCLKPNGYWMLRFEGISYLNHRVIWFLLTGNDPARALIDHVDGNPKNNTFENLRVASLAENTHNTKISKNSRSGVKGVGWNKGKWQASLMVRGEVVYLGRFTDLEEAKVVIQEARIKYHKEFAKHE